MRRKSAVKWSLPVVVDEKINRIRWVIVDLHLKVEDVEKVLRTVEGKEDGEGWGLWVEEDSKSRAFGPKETPFVPWNRTAKYYFRRAVRVSSHS